MDFKQTTKRINRFIAWLGLSFCLLLVKAVPGFLIYSFAEGLASLVYIVAVKQRKIALLSLANAFGHEKSDKEIQDIAKGCFSSMAKSGVELIYLINRPALLKQRISIIGRENLEQALNKGKGIILVSAHFGNFPLMLARLSMDNYKVGGIMRPMRDARVEKIFLAKRDYFGVRTIYSIPRKECIEETIRSLRNNEMLFIPLDQNFGTAGVFVDFFGIKAATATGPIVLARRTKAALVPCFIIRQSDNTHKIVFEPAVELEDKGDNQESTVFNIQKITNIIESYIRKYPAEWGWIHRRWKSRPSPIKGQA